MSKTSQPADKKNPNKQQQDKAAETTATTATETAKKEQPAQEKSGNKNRQAETHAEQPKKDATASGQPGKPANTPEPASNNGSGKGLATMALLVALGSAGFSGWQWYQNFLHVTNEQPQATAEAAALSDTSQFDSRLQTLQQELQADTQRFEQLERELAKLPRQDALEETRNALRKMQASQQAFTLRFESAFGNTRQDWRLAEAEHLLRMASLRLSALQDLSSARYLIEAADQILLEQDDPAAYASRDALAKALADIRALPTLDRAGLFMRLGAMQNQVGQLNQLLPGFNAEDSVKDPGLDWQKWLDKASSYIRIDLNSTEEIRPLLANQEVTHIRLAISLGLEQAQWAALNGEQDVYQQAIAQSLTLLEQYFAADHSVASAMRSQLAELAPARVSMDMPDINPALLALQAYIQERTLERRAPEVQP